MGVWWSKAWVEGCGRGGPWEVVECQLNGRALNLGRSGDGLWEERYRKNSGSAVALAAPPLSFLLPALNYVVLVRAEPSLGGPAAGPAVAARAGLWFFPFPE